MPRFVHPDDRRRMAAVKSDHKYLNLSSNFHGSMGGGMDSTEEVDMPNRRTPPPQVASESLLNVTDGQVEVLSKTMGNP